MTLPEASVHEGAQGGAGTEREYLTRGCMCTMSLFSYLTPISSPGSLRFGCWSSEHLCQVTLTQDGQLSAMAETNIRIDQDESEVKSPDFSASLDSTPARKGSV